MENISDEDLVRDFIAGNRGVYEVLFQRYYKKVYNLCLRFCNLDSNLAEEAAQETFLQVFKSLDRFKFRSSFYTWLYRVTFNTCSIAIKKQSKIKSRSLEEVSEQYSPESSEKGPGEKILDREYRSHVVRVLNELPEDQRKVMILGPIMGHSYKEISDIVGESVTVVKGRLFRARQNFKKRFQDSFQQDNFPDGEATN